MSNIFEIIERGRGKVLLFSGYQFYKHTDYKKGSSIWRCQAYKKTKCAGSVTIDTDQRTILAQKDHNINCLPNETQNLIDKSLSETCKQAAKGEECAPKVYKRGLKRLRESGLDLASSVPVPTFDQKKSSIYRKRNKKADVQKICRQTLDEVEIPAAFRQFVIADYNDGEIRIIVFCTQEQKEQMKQIKHFFVDGTFKCCPQPFSQVYSIHGDSGSTSTKTTVLPLLYAFMSHKSVKAYSILWDLIHSQIPEWTPQKVNMDFEEAAILALLQFHHGVQINGCHYHYTNCLWRKAKQLQINLKKNKLNRRIISLCCNLAHLPIEKINEGWDYIKTQIPEDPKFQKFQTYFESFWMKEKLQNIWCVFGERHRTNNTVEGWHDGINKDVPKNETNILMALNILFEDANMSNFHLSQIKSYSNSPKRKRQSHFIIHDDFVRDTQLELISGEINVPHFLDKLR